MHICIIGTGASGWIACTMLKKLEFIKKITIIGSSKIPSIGVGESTTLNFAEVLDEIELKKFVQESDAAVKYGVYYRNWSSKDFIHYFKDEEEYLRVGYVEKTWGQMLSNKDQNIHIHDLIGNKTWNFIQKNQVSLDSGRNPHSWHFDAGKFINFLKKVNLKDNKVKFIDDTIVDCKFLFENNIQYLIGQDNEKYKADYFVNCCGDNRLNERVFKEEYVPLSSYLLTNKAVVYPLEYTDKKNQFHPYTVAKTMNFGWRWITPTQSRIGTGYVFSDNHISVDEAINEFVGDIGDKKIEPLLVDFNPKYNKKPFKFNSNSCTIGMSDGFLEPLDAPGLSMTIIKLNILSELLSYKKDKDMLKYNNFLNTANHKIHINYQWWCTFILHQYKTCWRNDSKFWIDHKSVKCEFYDQIINNLGFAPQHLFENHEYMMLFLTTAGKDIQWKSRVKDKPFPIEQLDTKTIHHLDYIKSFYD